jgi:hypothetical protein
MQQTVRRTGQLVSGAGKPAVRAEDTTVHSLDPAHAAVWFAADGARDAAGLLAELRTIEAEATQERLFKLLDELSEMGVVDGRLAPPADGLDRRGLFRRFAFGAAAAVVAAPVLAKAGNAHAEVSAVCLDDMAFHVREAQQKKGLDKVEQDLANEMKEKVKLDDKAAELKVKAEQKAKVNDEEKMKGFEAKMAAEQNAKQDSYKEEASLKVLHRQKQGGIKQERALKAYSQQRRFGVGPSGVFVTVSEDEVFEAMVELGDIVMSENDKGCTMSFRFIVDNSSLNVVGGSFEAFDQSLIKMQDSGGSVAIQWGTNGEFLAEGTPVAGGVEILSTDAKTGKPLRLARWTHIAFAHSAF